MTERKWGAIAASNLRVVLPIQARIVISHASSEARRAGRIERGLDPAASRGFTVAVPPCALISALLHSSPIL